MKKPISRILGILSLLLGTILILTGLSPLWQASPPPPEPTPSVSAEVPVTPTSELLDNFAPDTAVGELDRDVTASDADLNQRSVHLALGFATGGFGQDPVAQRAMSEIGQQFLSHLLVPGDTISMFGFEKKLGPAVWNLPFSSQSGPQIATLWGQLKPGEGGSDYNDAILNSLPNLHPQENHNTVLVLISPWDASQSASTDKTPPKFADLNSTVLQQYGLKRMPPFKITYHQKSGDLTRTVYLTFVLPTHFTSERLDLDRHASLAKTTSNSPQLIPGSAAIPAGQEQIAEEAPHTNKPLVGIGFLLLILGVIFLLLPASSISKITLGIGSGSQDFYGPWRVGEEICRIVGGGLPVENGRRALQVSSAPPVVLAEIVQGASGPAVRSEHLITADGGQSGQSGYVLRKGPLQIVKIEGKSIPQAGLPPVPFSVSLEVTLS